MSDSSGVFASLLIVSIVLTALFTLPRLHKRHQRSIHGGNSYQDDDGTSTKVTQFAFDRERSVFIYLLSFVSLSGFVVNSAVIFPATAGLSAQSYRISLLSAALKASAAALLALQGIIVALDRSPTDRQYQGIVASICCSLVYGANIGYDLRDIPSREVRIPFLVAHITLLLLLLVIYVTIPRRPVVFRNGNPQEPVDGEQTASVLSRYTLSWANALLSKASQEGRLDFKNLPQLSKQFTAETLVSRFHLIKHSRLWKQTVLAHKSDFTSQWITTFFCSLATFAPQYILYRLVKTLETSSTIVDPQANLWLVLLALSQLIQPWLETWVLWIGWTHIALPIQVQLSGLIVEKCLRQKDVKSVTSEKKLEHGKRSPREDKRKTDESEEVTTSETQHGINLITVDAQRISEFLSYNSIIKSILLALGSVIFLIPLHMFAKSRYNLAQNGLMDARDHKATTISEAIEGIRQIKFDALEQQWAMLLHTVRTVELSWQWKAYVAETLLMICWVSGPYLFAAVALSSMSVYENGLSPAVAFTSLAIFQRLEIFLSLVPEIITDISNAWVSFDRLEKFLCSSEHVDHTIQSDSIEFRHAFVAWPSNENVPRQAQLHDIDFEIPNHVLSIINGSTGAGKSLLLSAIIGEADILSGSIKRPKRDLNSGFSRFDASKPWVIPKKTAFVAQIPWVENATIRNNVLFGLPFAQDRYSQVLNACAMSQDLKIMEDGDQTEVGARGISLSGGQRLRLSLARALYSQAEILVIDDVFSAIDTHVARHIIDNALTGKLVEERTVILVTHNVLLCQPKASFIITLNEGKVAYAGPPPDFTHSQSHPGNGDEAPWGFAEVEATQGAETIAPTTVNQSPQVSAAFAGSQPKRAPQKLVQDERRMTGRIEFNIYKRYLSAASRWPWLYWTILVILVVGSEVSLIGRDWWIKAWTEESSSPNASFNYSSSSKDSMSPSHWQKLHMTTDTLEVTPLTYSAPRNTRYIVGFVSLSLFLALLGAGKFLWAYIGSLRASRYLFIEMTEAVLHAPLRWLDTVPSGRILNRFIADFNVLDANLANHLILLVWSSLQFTGIIIVGTLLSPFLLLLSAPLVIASLIYARRYLAGARDVKRLQSITRSPILDQLESILSGLDTIRAWDKPSFYINHMYQKIDDNARCTWHLWLFNRWLGIRFAVIGAIFTCGVAVLSVYSQSVSASLAALALTFSLEFASSIFWVLRRYADVEMDMNSLERVIEYCSIQKEPSGGNEPPAHWPAHGQIDISGLEISYAPDMPAVLSDITFSCEPCSRVGVVGRTGAGKSSLLLALLRFLEARVGSISIDGLDISTLNLTHLRERIGIIPQQPNLWLGTIRSNLDPFDEFDDVSLQQALEKVGLSQQSLPIDTAGGIDGSLTKAAVNIYTPIARGGLNISQGQRQLVCLARALLSRPKILLLDEPTSAVDDETYSAVQQTIEDEFKDVTLVVIAHKLSTVVDFDKVVVLEAGRLVEIGAPEKLLKQGNHFAQMIKESGDQALLDKLEE